MDDACQVAMTFDSRALSESAREQGYTRALVGERIPVRLLACDAACAASDIGYGAISSSWVLGMGWRYKLRAILPLTWSDECMTRVPTLAIWGGLSRHGERSLGR